MSDGWNHNLHYYRSVLSAVPEPCGRALDVGCGSGSLARLLARSCGWVIGIDADEGALSIAAEEQPAPANLSFVLGDIMSFPFPAASFDFIAAVAALHHLPLESGLTRLRELLAPGGVLAVVGLYRLSGVSDYLLAAVAVLVSRLLRVARGRSDTKAPMRVPQESLVEIREAARRLLPGAVFERRLLFRYTLVWRKPAA